MLIVIYQNGKSGNKYFYHFSVIKIGKCEFNIDNMSVCQKPKNSKFSIDYFIKKKKIIMLSKRASSHIILYIIIEKKWKIIKIIMKIPSNSHWYISGVSIEFCRIRSNTQRELYTFFVAIHFTALHNTFEH